jgi:hypothetical protein
MIHQAAHHFVHAQRFDGSGKLHLGGIQELSELGNVLAQRFGVEQSRGVGVIEVGRVVGDLVAEVDQLRFEGRPLMRKVLG